VTSAPRSDARFARVHLVLSPVIDVARDPRWGRIEEPLANPYCVNWVSLPCAAAG
jgi:beta-glucosidase-like glycosyl hydrolase